MSVPLSSEPTFPLPAGQSAWATIIDMITRETMNGRKEDMAKILDILCPHQGGHVFYALKRIGINPDAP